MCSSFASANEVERCGTDHPKPFQSEVTWLGVGSIISVGRRSQICDDAMKMDAYNIDI
jgi:hypothetical protein